MNKSIRSASPDEVKFAMSSGAIEKIRQYRKSSLEKDIDYELGSVEIYCRFDLRMAERYNLGFDFRLWRANKMRNERLKKRVSRLVKDKNAIFLTLTFNDGFMARSTTQETRRRYISRFLKEQCKEYVANIDFGMNDNYTRREHYHALVVPKEKKIDFARYREGFEESNINAERVRQDERTIEGISLYINKLTNHALKENGKCRRLIYSRS